jgi:hypothetical protein
MKHATVKVGGYTIPLIGVPVASTQQQCVGCKQSFHLTQITLDENGQPWCLWCLKQINQQPVSGQ